MSQGSAGPDAPAVDPDAPVSYRPDRRLFWYKLAGMIALAAAAVILGWRDHGALFMVGIGVVVLGGQALRDLVAPVRVAADPDGVTVIGGYAGRRRLTWSQIERVRVDDRTRLGRRTQLLEIDAGDDLYLFAQSELGTTCTEVAERLAVLKARSAQ